MFLLVQQLFGVFTRSQLRRLLMLQSLMVLMAFAEIGGVSAIGIFMAVVADPNILNRANFIGKIYQISGVGDRGEFIYLVGVVALVVLVLTAMISMLTVWRAALFSARVGQEMADRLFRYYMHQPWLFHSWGSSAELTKRISSDAYVVSSQVIYPLMQINTKVILTFFMILGLTILNPFVVLIALAIFGCGYVILYRMVRQRLMANGKRISEIASRRYKLMAEGFGGIKDVLLLGRQAIFVKRFQTSGDTLSVSLSTNDALAMAPKYFTDLVAFSSVILLFLYLTKNYQGDLATVLPMLALYALAGFKVLPALQQIYHAVATIKGSSSAFDAIKEDLKNSLSFDSQLGGVGVAAPINALTQSIVLQDITFTYPGKFQPALKSLSLKIPANKSVGFVGSTGSGKSTLVDLVIGLLSPDEGKILIDGVLLTPRNMRSWQNKIGLVSQSIFLSDASIKENVAFGIPLEHIDTSRVLEVLARAHLDEFIAELPDGIETRVGERGVQLSGGQRQRVGIARSLYHNPEILVFDEATSALDGITEKSIMEAINDFSGKKTIILIAHRFTTIQQCNIIYFIDKGRVIDQGTYEELMERNAQFRAMSSSHSPSRVVA
jgi:ABC-type multidrug transport system fused ATPase/permease subunit